MELELLKYLEPITEEEQKYLDGKNTTDEYKDTEAQITETRLYSISDIFCTGYARYF